MANWHDAFRLGTSTNITMSSSSQATSAFSSQTRYVRISTGAQPAFFVIGDATPTATTSSPQLPANWTEYLSVTPGQKISVLQAGTAGVFSVCECVI